MSINITNEDNMELMKRYKDNYFELAIVDPPYGLGSKVVNSGGRFKRYENKNGNWDNAIPTKEYFNELYRVSKNQIIWGGNYFGLAPNRCFLIWDKKQPQDVSFSSCEYAWTNFDKPAKTFYRSPQNQTMRFHPTQKPIKLYEWLLMNYAKQGDKILDTHLGSGSIAIACHNLGYKLTACELDTEYYNNAIKRLKQHQAQQRLFV